MLEISIVPETAFTLIQILEPTVVEVERYRERTDRHSGEFLPLAHDQDALRRICRFVGKITPDDEVIDVYNPSLIFDHTGTEYVAGRVELSGKLSEHSSVSMT